MDQSSVSVFSMGVPVSAKQVSADSFLTARTLRRGVLDVLRLVEEYTAEMSGSIEVDVALERVVRRHDDIAFACSSRARRSAFDPATAIACSDGAKRAISSSQL